jgi:hypothetical protein
MRIEKQLSVFLENRPGALAKMCEALARRGVNILALSISDTADYAVVRMVVNKTDEAEHVIGDSGALVVDNDVLVMEVDNKTGSLGKLAAKLSKAGINIDYAYCTAAEDQPTGVLVLRTQDPQKTLEVLS